MTQDDAPGPIDPPPPLGSSPDDEPSRLSIGDQIAALERDLDALAAALVLTRAMRTVAVRKADRLARDLSRRTPDLDYSPPNKLPI